MAERKTTEAAATAETPGDGASDPERIESEIEETREELGETVAALADKTDVKKQAKQKVEETKAAARDKASDTAESAKQTVEDLPEQASAAANRAMAAVQANPAPAAAGALGLLLVVLLIRRARR